MGAYWKSLLPSICFSEFRLYQHRPTIASQQCTQTCHIHLLSENHDKTVLRRALWVLESCTVVVILDWMRCAKEPPVWSSSIFSPQNKSWNIHDGLPVNDFSRAKMDATAAELVEERDTALSFLSQWLAVPPTGTPPQQQHLEDPQNPPDSRLWPIPPLESPAQLACVCTSLYVCVFKVKVILIINL